MLGGDRRQHSAGRPPARVGHERHRPLGQVAAQPPRTTDDVARLEVVARPQLLQERAAQRLLGLVARLGHRDLGQRGDRGDVQVLAGVGGPRAEHQHGSELLAAGDDRHLGHHLRRALGLTARQLRGDIALVGAQSATGVPSRGNDHRDRRAGVSLCDLRDALETVPRQHGAHHFQVGAARRR